VFKFTNKNLIPFAVFLAVVALLFVLLPFFRNPVLDVLRFPLIISKVIQAEIKGLIFYHRNFIQNERLKSENDLLKNKLANTHEIYLENARLKNLLSFKQKTPYKVISARVIGRDPSNWASVIIIDKGRKQGVKRGFVSVTFLGLAGRVVEASDSTSKILLINDPNLSVSAMVRRSRQEGLVVGSLGGSLIMKYLPKECDINVTDEIITSGLTQNYPKGLLIGTVSETGEDFSSSMRYAVIKPAVNLASLEEVLVIIP
jgi:rod shape-determining protein MreC